VTRLSRRDLLKRVGAAAGAGTLAAPAIARGGIPSPPDRGEWSARLQPSGQQSESVPITVGGRAVEVILTPVSALTSRITVVPVSTDGDTDIFAPGFSADGSLVTRTWPPPAARFTTLVERRTVRSGDLTVVAAPRDVRQAEVTAFGVQIQAADGRAPFTLRVDERTGGLAFSLGGGAILGLGEGGPQFDRRGSTDRMRSGQGGYQLRTHGGRVPVQWMIGTSGWSMFIHRPEGTFDFTGPETRFDGNTLPIDLFVVGARDPAGMMAEYAALTGFPALPPLWAFGYQQSHRTLASREEIVQEAKTFRQKQLPCETLIYLGTGFCPSGWNTDNGEFTFNPRVFQDPKAVIDELHAEHFKVVLHIVLEGRTLGGTVADSCAAAPLPSGKRPDGTWPDDRQVACYWPAHKPLFDLGVDGWWPDQGDGLNASSRLVRNRMYWDGARAWRPNERPFALHRNGHAGMQRYGAFLWSGDVFSTWDTLKTHVPVAVNTGLSGIPFWGTDIGGFVPTKELTGELYVRWFQFAAFCPLFRAHGRTWKLRLPWGWNTGRLDPDEVLATTAGAANPDASELHNAAVEPVCRKYLELRSRLMPYLYSAVRDTCVTGLPIVRALWLHYPLDVIAATRGDEYLWGRDILVAPVVEKGATNRNVYLPEGRWHDFWQEDVYQGGREVARRVDLETMPLFVRAGAIVPLGPVRQYTAERSDEPVALNIYPGANGSFTLYEDDGRSFDYERGDWMGVDMQWNDASRRLTLRLTPGSRFRPPAERRFRVRVAGARSSRDIRFVGTLLEVRL
jgi:alpha-glucosidase (family GH31 glycosyl hydrolase)